MGRRRAPARHAPRAHGPSENSRFHADLRRCRRQNQIPERASHRERQSCRSRRPHRVGSHPRRAASRRSHHLEGLERPPRQRAPLRLPEAGRRLEIHARHQERQVARRHPARHGRRREETHRLLPASVHEARAHGTHHGPRRRPQGRNGFHLHPQPEPASPARRDRADALHPHRQRRRPHLLRTRPLRPIQRRQRRRRRRSRDSFASRRQARARAMDAPRRFPMVHAIPRRALRRPNRPGQKRQDDRLPSRSLHARDAGRSPHRSRTRRTAHHGRPQRERRHG